MVKRISLLLLFIFFLSKPVLASGVEYNLPYPGMLPDSPLYVLKVVRDNVVTSLIFDSKQKAFYYLFLSDKRLAAAQTLLAKKEPDLAVTTVLKAQDYYSQAVALADKIKNSDLNAKLVVAGRKHEDVISEMQTKMPGIGDDRLKLAFDTNQKSKDRVLELLVAR